MPRVPATCGSPVASPDSPAGTKGDTIEKMSPLAIESVYLLKYTQSPELLIGIIRGMFMASGTPQNSEGGC